MHLALNYQHVDPSRGGAETYVADLCRHLVQGGHRVDLYAESWDDAALPREVNILRIRSRGRTRRERIWSFAQNSEQAIRQGSHSCSVGFINTWGQDVLIPQGGVHAASRHANARRFSPGLPRELYRLAKAVNPRQWLYRAIERRQYHGERPARVVAVSRMVQHDLERYHRVPRDRIRVIPNAIDPSRLDVDQPGAVRCAFRNRLGLEPSDLVGLFVAHNFALKGLGPLITALGARRRRDSGGRRIHLLVCGGGDPGRYRRLVHRLGLGDVVRFLGFYPEVRDCYWSSDFFVQPTYYDPCSLVVLEALACGLPVITTVQNGASELMVDGREGSVLAAPGAEAALVTALDRMADDSTRQTMSEHARRLGRRLTFEAHVAQLVDVFEEVAAARDDRGALPGQRAWRIAPPHVERFRRSRARRTGSLRSGRTGEGSP